MVDWEITNEGETPEVQSAIVGVWYIDPERIGEGDEENEVYVIGTVQPLKIGGFAWRIEDSYVGHVDDGVEDSEARAKQQCQDRANEWCADEP